MAKLTARVTYVILILLSLAVPYLQYVCSYEKAMHTMRGARGLTPAPLLIVDWFGGPSTVMALVLFILLVMSWKYDRLLKTSTLCFMSRVVLAYATAYGAYCCFILSRLLLEGKG